MSIEVIMPKGALGGHKDDDALDMALRLIGIGFGEEGDWSSKYGCDYENDVFLMKPFCWCDREGVCPWCCHVESVDEYNEDYAESGIFDRFKPLTFTHRYYDPPNFWFKPDNFRVIWYKYIGRGMETNKSAFSANMLEDIFATHPQGMTVKQAVEKYEDEQRAADEAFKEMLADLDNCYFDEEYDGELPN